MSNCVITSNFANNVLTIALDGRVDSSNATVIEKQTLDIRTENKEGKLEIDFEKLEYISSAGLRILLKLQKGEKEKILIKNVSVAVYEVFDMTGFVDIFDVKKTRRRLSIEGCKVIGKGGTATVYRLDSDTIVKVFREGTSMEIVEQENVRAKNALKVGVQTAISFDIVQVDNCIGVVYELLNSTDILTCMEEDHENYKKYVVDFANFVREMHGLEVDPALFPPVKMHMIHAFKFLEGSFATSEEVQKLQAIWQNLPDSNHFIHGDCHVGNVMLQGDELMFIDLAANGSGHPVVDFLSMYFCYYFCNKYSIVNPNDVLMRSFTKEEGIEIWNTFVSTYLQTDDKALIAKVTELADALSCSRILLAWLRYPGMFKPEEFKLMLNHAIAYYDRGLEPVCF